MSNENELNKLSELGMDFYNELEDYTEKLQTEIGKAIQRGIKTESDRELRLIRQSIELNIRSAGRLRHALKSEERRMIGIIKGIDGIFSEMQKEPKRVIIEGFKEFNRTIKKPVIEGLCLETGSPLEKKDMKSSFNIDREDIICPHCKKLNTNFKYGTTCYNCHELIENPRKDHTTCPKCNEIINTCSIYSDPTGYQLDHGKIKCPYCETFFEYKKYVSTSLQLGLRVCIICDKPYIPNKRKWKTQTTCSKACSDKKFKIEQPDYQKEYRNKKK